MVKILTFVIVILALIFIPIIIYYISLIQEKDRIKDQVLAFSTIAKPMLAQKESRLDDITMANFSKYGNDYAVVVKNLKTGEEYKYNENKKYDSASLYKLWIMGVAFQKIKEGTFEEDQVISGQMRELDTTLSTVTPTPTPEGFIEPEDSEESDVVSMSLRDGIERMITYSDNYSALLIASKSGTFSVTNFLKNNGLSNSSFRSPPQTTAMDIAKYYEKLYKGEIIDEENSLKMLEILKKQTINDRIPKYLPKGTITAHKTGELFGSKHDSGIVFSDNGDYLVVVMSDTKDPRVAAEKTANFSKQIFDYFEE